MTSVYEKYLFHEGVKGMRWGHRKDRYANKNSSQKPASSSWKSKDAKTLSDDELKSRLTRLKREKEYKQLTVSRGRKAANWIAKTAGTILVATAITAASNKMMNDVYKNALDKKWPPSKS